MHAEPVHFSGNVPTLETNVQATVFRPCLPGERVSEGWRVEEDVQVPANRPDRAFRTGSRAGAICRWRKASDGCRRRAGPSTISPRQHFSQATGGPAMGQKVLMWALPVAGVLALLAVNNPAQAQPPGATYYPPPAANYYGPTAPCAPCAP